MDERKERQLKQTRTSKSLPCQLRKWQTFKVRTKTRETIVKLVTRMLLGQLVVTKKVMLAMKRQTILILIIIIILPRVQM